jgi:hypothetical protein
LDLAVPAPSPSGQFYLAEGVGGLFFNESGAMAVADCRRRIGRLMGEAELACKTRRKFKAPTTSRHNFPIAVNRLDREFKVNNPNQVNTGDITTILTQEGWLVVLGGGH